MWTNRCTGTNEATKQGPCQKVYCTVLSSDRQSYHNLFVFYQTIKPPTNARWKYSPSFCIVPLSLSFVRRVGWISLLKGLACLVLHPYEARDCATRPWGCLDTLDGVAQCWQWGRALALGVELLIRARGFDKLPPLPDWWWLRGRLIDQLDLILLIEFDRDRLRTRWSVLHVGVTLLALGALIAAILLSLPVACAVRVV